MDEAESPPACNFQSARLLPEIRIDTSRLDVLLSGFQKRLTVLETSFARVAESAAEAAHKVGGCCRIQGHHLYTELTQWRMEYHSASIESFSATIGRIRYHTP